MPISRRCRRLPDLPAPAAGLPDHGSVDAGRDQRIIENACPIQEQFPEYTALHRNPSTSRAWRRWHAEAPEGHQGQRRHGRRDARPALRRQLVGRTRGRGAEGGTPTRTGTPALGCVPTTFPAALGSSSGPVPEPDPAGLRDRATAGGRAQGPGRAARDRRRGPHAGRGRQHVPLLLRDPGHTAEDPQRRLDQADPRELARRDGRLDGGALAVAVRPLGASDQRERRRRRRRGLPHVARPAAAGDHQRHSAAPM